MTDLGTCGPHRLLRFLESGGMGEIFLAHGPKPATEGGGTGLVAIKRLLPQAAQDRTFIGMFMDEAHLATQLDHPNIARVHQLGRERETYFLVMEWVDGVSLARLVRRAVHRGSSLPVPVVTRIVADTARALGYAHHLTDRSGQPYRVVHRDVSPPNIMIGYDGRVKLLDFGLAKARTQLQKTQPGLLKGKFGYLAPEQLSGAVDPRIDIWALGLCLYEGLVGEQLFGQQTAAATIHAINAYRTPPSISTRRPDVPASLEAVVRRALARDPSERFQSAEEMRRAVEGTMAESSRALGDDELGTFVQRMFPDREPPPPIPIDTVSEAAAAVDAEPSGGGAGGKAALLALAVAVVVAAAAGAFFLLTT